MELAPEFVLRINPDITVYDDGWTDVALWPENEGVSHLLGYWGPLPAISSLLIEDQIHAQPEADIVAVLTKVSTDYDRRRRGVGRALVKNFVALCSENNVGEIYLYASPTEYIEGFNLVGWYESLGFHRLSDEDEPVMLRRLPRERSSD